MKNRIITLSVFGFLLAFTSQLSAQKYFTKEGRIQFLSEAPVEKIEATNNKATSVFDVETGKIQWAVLIKAFKFEKALMEEHFNENYMESSEFPKAQFKGEITNMSDIDLAQDGEYEATLKGDLTIHGVTKSIEETAKFTVTGGMVSAMSEMTVLLPDYEIEVPAVVRENISDEIAVKIMATYAPLEKK